LAAGDRRYQSTVRDDLQALGLAPVTIALGTGSTFALGVRRRFVSLLARHGAIGCHDGAAGRAVAVIAKAARTQFDAVTTATAPVLDAQFAHHNELSTAGCHRAQNARGWTSSAKCATLQDKPHRGGYGQARDRVFQTWTPSLPGLGAQRLLQAVNISRKS
jgi:hypothetical protein